MHQARGIKSPNIPVSTVPIIINTFAKVVKVELWGCMLYVNSCVGQPHFTQTTASSNNSAPHLAQYFIQLPFYQNTRKRRDNSISAAPKTILLTDAKTYLFSQCFMRVTIREVIANVVAVIAAIRAKTWYISS